MNQTSFAYMNEKDFFSSFPHHNCIVFHIFYTKRIALILFSRNSILILRIFDNVSILFYGDHDIYGWEAYIFSRKQYVASDLQKSNTLNIGLCKVCLFMYLFGYFHHRMINIWLPDVQNKAYYGSYWWTEFSKS